MTKEFQSFPFAPDLSSSCHSFLTKLRTHYSLIKRIHHILTLYLPFPMLSLPLPLSSFVSLKLYKDRRDNNVEEELKRKWRRERRKEWGVGEKEGKGLSNFERVKEAILVCLDLSFTVAIFKTDWNYDIVVKNVSTIKLMLLLLLLSLLPSVLI